MTLFLYKPEIFNIVKVFHNNRYYRLPSDKKSRGVSGRLNSGWNSNRNGGQGWMGGGEDCAQINRRP